MLTVFPVATLSGRKAVISSGFGEPRDGGSRQHMGADIMFRRIQGDVQPVGDGLGSQNYVMPSGHPALAAGDGRVTQSEMTGTGYTVKIDHGNGVGTAYRHLQRGNVSVGQLVKAGDIVGPIGDSPKGGDPNHLHFEITINGSYINPADSLKNLKHVSAGLSVLTFALLVGGGILLYRRLK